MDGFADFAGLIAAAGPAATDMSVVNCVSNSHLPATGGASCARSRPPARVGGRRGRRRAARPRTPASPDRSAAYTAQAAEILLDAIARSDGTRSSVTDELRRTRVEHGILGDIRFDHDGDVVKAPVTMFRIAGKRAVVDRVITVSAASRGAARRPWRRHRKALGSRARGGALVGNHDYAATGSVEPAWVGAPGSAGIRSLELARERLSADDVEWLRRRRPAARRDDRRWFPRGFTEC